MDEYEFNATVDISRKIIYTMNNKGNDLICMIYKNKEKQQA